MWVYPDYMVVMQEGSYSGTGCAPGYIWSFYWADFDPATQQRIYSTLLAAKLSRTPIRPITATSGCGPEGKLKFLGQLVLWISSIAVSMFQWHDEYSARLCDWSVCSALRRCIFLVPTLCVGMHIGILGWSHSFGHFSSGIQRKVTCRKRVFSLWELNED